MCMETQYHRGGGNDTKYTCTYVHVYTESVAHDAGGGNLGREWKIAVHSLLCMKPCNDVTCTMPCNIILCVHVNGGMCMDFFQLS